MMRFSRTMVSVCAVAGFGWAAQAGAAAEYRIEIKNHLFIPSILEIPADTKVKLKIVNQDITPEEFESYELNREKIVVGGGTITIYIGPLAPGEYPFFGEFNPRTAQGVVIAK
jgi:hypothetical protein